MVDIPLHISQLVSIEHAWKYGIVPIKQSNGQITLLAKDNSDDLKRELTIVLGYDTELVMTNNAEIEQLLHKYYRKENNEKLAASRLDISSEGILNALIKDARQLRSSDIHIESEESAGRIRYRIDGALMERVQFERKDLPGLINKIKVQARLDISEKRLPQDGRIQSDDDEKLDIRVSILPCLHGEKAVLRILGDNASLGDLTTIGFTDMDLEIYERNIKKPTGIILVSGPTGSGKTTTLYSTLQKLNQKSKNIVTIEDPIEYTLDGINQVQLKEKIGMGFPQALRTFLRQDPDIIMVGEIRDKETAEMAIRASLTGHLVLSSIHTNSALGTISRLIDMGIQPFLIAETLNISVAQRLLRLLCIHCKEKVTTLDEHEVGLLPSLTNDDTICKAVGCPECHFTGYSGRQAIFEIIELDAGYREAIKSDHMGKHIEQLKLKPKLLKEKATNLLFEGKTSMNEVYPYLIS